MLPRELAARSQVRGERLRREHDRFVFMANHWRPRGKKAKYLSKQRTRLDEAKPREEWERAKEYALRMRALQHHGNGRES